MGLTTMAGPGMPTSLVIMGTLMGMVSQTLHAVSIHSFPL
jgi:hypothetical protein